MEVWEAKFHQQKQTISCDPSFVLDVTGCHQMSLNTGQHRLISLRGAIKKKQEKVGLCPTFGNPPNFTKKCLYTRYYTLILVMDEKFHLKSGIGNDPAPPCYGTKSHFYLFFFIAPLGVGRLNCPHGRLLGYSHNARVCLRKITCEASQLLREL